MRYATQRKIQNAIMIGMLAGCYLLATAVEAEPLNGDSWNDCPPIWGNYALSVPNQSACELEIEAPYSDPEFGPLNELVRKGTVTCDGGDRMPVTLHYETAPGYCKVNANIRVRTLVLVADENLWQAVSGNWSGLVPSGDSTDEACQATDHWYHFIVPYQVYAINESTKPDGGSLFRCKVEGYHTLMNQDWETVSGDFNINSHSGTTEMRSEAVYRVSLDVMPDGVLEDPEATVETGGDSWNHGVVTAVPQ